MITSFFDIHLQTDKKAKLEEQMNGKLTLLPIDEPGKGAYK